MVQTKEEKRAYSKRHYEANKEKKALQQRIRYQANKEMIRMKGDAYYQSKQRDRNKTPKGKRISRLNAWNVRGVIGDLKKFYDERYLPATQCEVCEKEFKSSRHKCMDHCHETGEIRWVLCHSCNNHDHWKKVLARKEENNTSINDLKI